MARPRDRRVLHLKAANQRRLHIVSLPPCASVTDCAKPSMVPLQFDVVALHRPSPEATLFRRLDHLPGIAVVDVDHCSTTIDDQVAEQTQLSSEIGFQVG